MSVDTNTALGRRFFEAQDRMMGGPDPDLCVPAYTAHIGTNPQMTLAHHQEFAKAFYAGFPDLRHTIEETVADDQKVAVQFTLRGTHTEFMGIPPTHKSFEAGAVAILTIEKGKVVALRGQFDQLGMLRQLGVVP
jgi:predicted ester cyclase